jgi:hypothetical protein
MQYMLQYFHTVRSDTCTSSTHDAASALTFTSYDLPCRHFRRRRVLRRMNNTTLRADMRSMCARGT